MEKVSGDWYQVFFGHLAGLCLIKYTSGIFEAPVGRVSG